MRGSSPCAQSSGRPLTTGAGSPRGAARHACWMGPSGGVRPLPPPPPPPPPPRPLPPPPPVVSARWLRCVAGAAPSASAAAGRAAAGSGERAERLPPSRARGSAHSWAWPRHMRAATVVLLVLLVVLLLVVLLIRRRRLPVRLRRWQRILLRGPAEWRRRHWRRRRRGRRGRPRGADRRCLRRKIRPRRRRRERLRRVIRRTQPRRAAANAFADAARGGAAEKPAAAPHRVRRRRGVGRARAGGEARSCAHSASDGPRYSVISMSATTDACRPVRVQAVRRRRRDDGRRRRRARARARRRRVRVVVVVGRGGGAARWATCGPTAG